MRNGEVGVKNEEVGWIPVVRRKKSTRSEEKDSSRNLMIDLNKEEA